jgi:hypothetical protein
MNMKLSAKAVRFVIEALEHYHQFQDDRLAHGSLSDDEVSDLENDQLFIDAIKADLEKYQNELAGQRENVKADI